MERLFLEYLSRERVGSGQAVGDAEDLVESQQRAEIIGKTIAAAWTQIVETPDELLVDLISETSERICGFKPEPELVQQFLAGRADAPDDALDGSPFLVLSRETSPPSAKRTRREGQGSTLPIALDQQDPQTSWTLCYALRKRGLKCRTAMAAKRFAAGMPHA